MPPIPPMSTMPGGTEKTRIKRRISSASPSGFRIFGYGIILVTFGGVGAWAATARLSSATVAQGQVTLEGNRKVVQHFEGGIISSINVSEAFPVSAGDILIELNHVSALSDVERLGGRLAESLAVEARLLAEVKLNRHIAYVEQGDASPADELTKEQQNILDDRLALFNSQREILAARIQQLNRQAEGIKQQREALSKRVALKRRLLDRLTEGQSRGVVQGNALNEQQDELIQVEASLGDLHSRLAQVEVSVGEAKLNVIKLEQEFLSRANLELRDERLKISELRESLRVAQDRFERTKLRAPTDGTVQNLTATTVGSVIGPGEVLMEIVPFDDKLLIAAQIPPLDINNVIEGMETEVRFTAFKARLTPVMLGVVETISKDVIVEPNAPPYYLARIRVPEENMTDEIRNGLTPGMPADVVIVSGERRVIDYLVSPLKDALAKSMRER